MTRWLMRGFALLGMTSCLAAANASARECLGVSFPEQLSSDGGTLVLNGLGLREATIFKVNVYVAALYVPRASADAPAILAAGEPYVMRLHFVRDVSATDIAKGWSEGFERNSHGQMPATDPRVSMVRSRISAVQAGQELRFTFKPGAGVDVNVNGMSKGTIPGDDFGRALLSIWLGVPPNPEIKAGLLGGQCG